MKISFEGKEAIVYVKKQKNPHTFICVCKHPVMLHGIGGYGCGRCRKATALHTIKLKSK